MAREKKISLAVIAVLLLVFGGLLYRRLTQEKVTFAAKASAQAADMPAPRVLPISEAPTIVRASAEMAAPQLPAEFPAAEWTSASGPAKAAGAAAGEPHRSFLPVQANAPATDLSAEVAPQLQASAADEIGPVESKNRGNEAQAPSDPFQRRAADEESGAAAKGDANYGMPARLHAGESARLNPNVGDEAQPEAIDSEPQPTLSKQVSAGASDAVAVRPNYEADEPMSQPAPVHTPTATPGFRTFAEEPAGESYVMRPAEAADGPPAYDAAPAGARAPLRQGDKYIVGPNDSYWNISQKVYGHGGYFKAIFEHNRKAHPRADRLQVGDVLVVPEAAVLQQKYPDLTPKPRKELAPIGQRMATVSARTRQAGRVYVVEEGDNLFDIARYELGKAARWGEIYEMNREVLGDDYDYLRPGLELVLPTDEAPDPITRRAGDTYHR